MSAGPDLQLNVASVTGIDVALPLSGAGARAYAYLIDWLIRVTLALSWYVVAALIYNRSLSLSPPLANEPRWFGLVVLPAFALYLLYYLVLEVAMRGRTPGKRAAGIRVVSRDGGPAGAGALLVRNVFRLLDAQPGSAYGVGLATMLVSRESLRFGDMAAGTVVIYDHGAADIAPEAAAQRLGTLDAAGAEIVADLLARWDTLQPEARVRLSRLILERYLGAAADLSTADEWTWRGRIERLARS